MIDTILNLWNLGGIMMYPLFLLAFVGFLIFLERMLYMRKERIKTVEFLTGIKSKLSKGNDLEALTIAESTPGAVARLTKQIILSFVGVGEKQDKIEVVKQSVISKALLEISMLNKGIYIVGIVARLCPVVGLLGTLIAMLQAFQTMADAGAYASISLFSEQIYNAIISSVFGLLFYLIFLLFHSLLKAKMRAALRDMQWAINELISFIMKGMPEKEELYHKGNERG